MLSIIVMSKISFKTVLIVLTAVFSGIILATIYLIILICITYQFRINGRILITDCGITQVEIMDINCVFILLMVGRVAVVLAITALLVVLGVAQTNPKLIYVQEVFRHGARFPIYPSKNDNSYYAKEQRSAGELTKQGKSMHYLLGQTLYTEYWEKLFPKGTPFNAVYNQSKFYVKSTNVNRTIESVQSQLAGIFENLSPLSLEAADYQFSVPQWPNVNRSSNDVFMNLPKFNPIAIHVQKGYISPWDNGDFLRTYSSQFCYKQKDFAAANRQNSYVKQIINHPNITRAIGVLRSQLNKDVTFWDANQYFDNAQCMKYQRQSGILPVFTENSDDTRALNAIYRMETYISLFYTEEQLKIVSTGYFNETVNQFKRVTANQEGVQWAFYSAHDTTVANFLARLGLTSVKCIYDNYLLGNAKNTDTCILEYPNYTANLIFQVYQYLNGTNTFKIRYNGQYRKIPFCDWSFQCKVETFYSWYDSWKDEKFVAHCGVKNSEAETLFTILIIALGIILVFVISSIIRYLNQKHKKQEELMVVDKAKNDKVTRDKNENIMKESLLSQQ